MTPKIEHVVGSGNVFADIGLPQPEQALAKAELARQINRIIKEKNLSQAQAAQILGVDQPRISALSKGRLSFFSLEKMMQFASRLGNEVEILVKPSSHQGIKVLDVEGLYHHATERRVLSAGLFGGQAIELMVLMDQTYRRQPAMRIDQSAMQEVFGTQELVPAA